MAKTLIIPGLFGSDDGHWQRHWLRDHPDAVLVEQNDWNRPRLDAWRDALEREILRHGVVDLVAHSLGSLLVADLARRPGLAARFAREARVAAAIQSPHVTRVNDVDTTEDGTPFIVMELLQGQSLASLLSKEPGGRLSPDEAIDITLIVTEGFGTIRMADRTFRLLQSLEGQLASINGATQIRAGVMRPEIVVPHPADHGAAELPSEGQDLSIGTPIRVIREPYFGRLGQVAALPPELQQIPSGAMVRVLEADLDGERVTVPRANVEIIEQ